MTQLRSRCLQQVYSSPYVIGGEQYQQRALRGLRVTRVTTSQPDNSVLFKDKYSRKTWLRRPTDRRQEAISPVPGFPPGLQQICQSAKVVSFLATVKTHTGVNCWASQSSPEEKRSIQSRKKRTSTQFKSRTSPTLKLEPLTNPALS